MINSEFLVVNQLFIQWLKNKIKYSIENEKEE
jgi:hypothetical protein